MTVDFDSRLDRAREMIKQLKIDGLFLTTYEENRYFENVFYLCGYTGSNGQLLVTPRRTIFLTDGRYATQAEQEVVADKIIVYRWRERWQKMTSALKAARVRKIGIGTELKWGEYRKLGGLARLADATESLSKLRIVKDKAEIGAIVAAIRLQEAAFRMVRKRLRAGASEEEVARALEVEIIKRGGQLSFDTIVASGPRAAMPHAKPSERKMQAGELVTVDFGSWLRGYCSDQTVTYGVGKVDKSRENIFGAVKRARDLAIEAVVPGVNLSEVDRIARVEIESAGYGKYFVHNTGHGIGLRVHEPPSVGRDSKDVAEPGMIFSIEPGIYLPNRFGVRLEDLVLVTSRGHKVLTSLSKSL